jgi:hypothetical protein
MGGPGPYEPDKRVKVPVTKGASELEAQCIRRLLDRMIDVTKAEYGKKWCDGWFEFKEYVTFSHLRESEWLKEMRVKDAERYGVKPKNRMLEVTFLILVYPLGIVFFLIQSFFRFLSGLFVLKEIIALSIEKMRSSEMVVPVTKNLGHMWAAYDIRFKDAYIAETLSDWQENLYPDKGNPFKRIVDWRDENISNGAKAYGQGMSQGIFVSVADPMRLIRNEVYERYGVDEFRQTPQPRVIIYLSPRDFYETEERLEKEMALAKKAHSELKYQKWPWLRKGRLFGKYRKASATYYDFKLDHGIEGGVCPECNCKLGPIDDEGLMSRGDTASSETPLHAYTCDIKEDCSLYCKVIFLVVNLDEPMVYFCKLVEGEATEINEELNLPIGESEERGVGDLWDHLRLKIK